jgi:hypothetical protein
VGGNGISSTVCLQDTISAIGAGSGHLVWYYSYVLLHPTTPISSAGLSLANTPTSTRPTQWQLLAEFPSPAKTIRGSCVRLRRNASDSKATPSARMIVENQSRPTKTPPRIQLFHISPASFHACSLTITSRSQLVPVLPCQPPPARPPLAACMYVYRYVLTYISYETQPVDKSRR